MVQGNFTGTSGINVMLPRPSGVQATYMKEMPAKVSQDRSSVANGLSQNRTGTPANGSAPAAK